MTYECTCIKVSVSMPDDLVTTVSEYAGAAMFDRYIAAAVEQQLQLDELCVPSARFASLGERRLRLCDLTLVDSYILKQIKVWSEAKYPVPVTTCDLAEHTDLAHLPYERVGRLV